MQKEKKEEDLSYNKPFTDREQGRRRNTKKLLLKEGKHPKDVRNYIPIALRNILCKIFKSMINKRLVWFLDKFFMGSDGRRKPKQYSSKSRNLEKEEKIR